METDRLAELREKVAQLLKVMAAFDVTQGQLRARLKMHPGMHAELQRKSGLNDRTLEGLHRKLESNSRGTQAAARRANQARHRKQSPQRIPKSANVRRVLCPQEQTKSATRSSRCWRVPAPRFDWPQRRERYPIGRFRLSPRPEGKPCDSRNHPPK